jgi:CMP-N-acetylneuraminic acid synthetase
MPPRLLAIVPARSGSKRLVGKNTKMLGGRPLIAWTIECAKRAECFIDILVSTDSLEIAAVARDVGASAPWVRPEALASDSATSSSVCQHALQCYEADNDPVDAIVLLQPTCPFRRVSTITRAVRMFGDDPSCSVVGMTRARTHPYWCRAIDEAGFVRSIPGVTPSVAISQELPFAWQISGLLYLTPRETMLAGKLYTEPTRALTSDDDIENIDIDGPYDWLVAEAACQRVDLKDLWT